MFAPALGRNAGYGSLQDLQQSLLYAFARDIPRDRRVLALARDLVDFIDVDNALLGSFHIVVGRLNQFEQDVLDVLAHVAGFSERRGVGDGKRNVKNPGQGLSKKRLAGTRRAEQYNVALLQLDVVVLRICVDALIVVVHGDGQRALGPILPDNVLIEDLGYLPWTRDVAQLYVHIFVEFFLDN